ncbi:short-chain fatty acid transporter [Sporolituus thermophilus]|uniref:Short-chain fatty acids transporter n=1 Tax=Sporolituus thermophilus DSM 23256 TaxID=1123285 RepID=A0A1G7INK1_9FIRM|nr:TIGR00366 family protein [Sporolituus thermophilus]SDF14320.1 short-chain fatty acids transporter [Sporolituus thermophilus DSM 23256]
MINRILMFFVNLMQKYLPDPFTIAWLITLVVVVMAISITNTPIMKIINDWGEGFFGILAFAMQMALVIVSGYALAAAPVVRKFLQFIASIPHTPRQTILFIGFVSMALYYLNWGLGLIAGGLLAREAAKLHRDVDFRLLVTAAFSGIIITHGGLSASVPLLINTKGHFLEKEMGIIPLSQTIFHPQAIFITVGLAVIIPLVLLLMIPKKEDTVLADPALFEEEQSAATPVAMKKQLADHLDTSLILNYSLGFMGVAYIGYFFIKNGFNLNLNLLIFIFIILGILAHGSLINYTKAISKGANAAAGIILQYPFYSGIMGIMKGSGLVFVISDWLLKMSTYETFELACYFSSLIISIFIPSAGGHWVVQAPFMLPAAAKLGVEPWKVAMGVAWGESIWNVVCPFWALPLLAIANINIRDLIGFTVLLFIIGNIIAIMGIMLIPH